MVSSSRVGRPVPLWICRQSADARRRHAATSRGLRSPPLSHRLVLSLNSPWTNLTSLKNFPTSKTPLRAPMRGAPAAIRKTNRSATARTKVPVSRPKGSISPRRKRSLGAGASTRPPPRSATARINGCRAEPLRPAVGETIAGTRQGPIHLRLWGRDAHVAFLANSAAGAPRLQGAFRSKPPSRAWNVRALCQCPMTFGLLEERPPCRP